MIGREFAVALTVASSAASTVPTLAPETAHARGLNLACMLPPRCVFSRVSALATPDANTKTRYVIVSGDNGVSTADLQFQEYAGELVRALSTRGFEQQADPGKANVVIFLTYRISGPRITQSTTSTPVYGYSGGGTQQTTGMVAGSNGSAIFSATTTDSSDYGVQGYSSSTSTETLFQRELRISAHDFDSFRATKHDREIWQTQVVSVGSGADLRSVLPVLIAQATPYFAAQTAKAVDVTTRPSDALVKTIEGVSNRSDH